MMIKKKRKKMKKQFKRLDLPLIPDGCKYLTFGLIHFNLRHVINWQIQTELLAEDIRHYKRVVTMTKTLISVTGQYEYLPQFNDLQRRLKALQIHYNLYD